MKRFTRFLVYAGITAVVLGLSKVHARFIAVPPYSFTGSFRFAWAIAYIVLLSVAAYGLGVPDLPRTVRQALQTSAAAAAIGALSISLVQLVVGDALLPRFVVFGSAVALVPWYLACIAIAARGAIGAAAKDTVLIVSDTAALHVVRQELSRGAERPARVVAVLSTSAAAGPNDSAAQPLIETARREQVSVLVLDREAQGSSSVVAQAAHMHEQGTRVRTLSLFYEEWLGKLPVSELERTSLLFDIGEVHRARYVRVKRLVDIVLGAIATVGLVVLIPFVAIGNLFGNRGPLFYTQPRVGKGGSEFEIVKFRTMRATEGSDAPTEWTLEDDPRITRFGRILRISHIDEVPQALNILRGELSMVGPRPEQPVYVDELIEKLPFYNLRHLVRPGLTGWAQVKYGYAGDESDTLEKLQYEFFYLRRQNLSLDLRIVGRTLRSVLGREGR